MIMLMVITGALVARCRPHQCEWIQPGSCRMREAPCSRISSPPLQTALDFAFFAQNRRVKDAIMFTTMLQRRRLEYESEMVSEEEARSCERKRGRGGKGGKEEEGEGEARRRRRRGLNEGWRRRGRLEILSFIFVQNSIIHPKKSEEYRDRELYGVGHENPFEHNAFLPYLIPE